VQVSVVAPDEPDTEFEGYVRVENKNDPEDFDYVQVFLKTPANHNFVQKMSQQFIFKLKLVY
jgi:hypothetical protein